MTYAIIKTGATQEKVSKGDEILVNRLDQKVGDKVEFIPVAYVDEKKDIRLVTEDELKTVKVTGKVLAEERGEKIKIMKFKNKTRYHKRQGHRQDLTRVVIEKISKSSK